MPAFVDTNVLIYSIDPSEPRKAQIAADLLARTDLMISLQVLQEFVAQTSSTKKPWGLDIAEASRWTVAFRRFPVIETSIALLDRSLAICERYHFSYWDSSIVAAALIGGADTLLSEDMQHGQVIDGVRIINPFRADA
jgi:predicted nucleic acid-binding protein